MTASELQVALQAVEPAAVLVASSVLERIIRHTLKLPAWMWTVPHSQCFIVERQFLFRYVEQEDLLLKHDQLLPATVLLFPIPEGRGDSSKDTLLLEYWRRLFHASVDLALANQGMEGKWTPAAVQECIDRLGTTAFEEIRNVLVQENWLPAEADARAVYLEFVAVFWELYYFARRLLPSYFPSLNVQETRDLLSRHLDAEALFRQTRLPGARDPDLALTPNYHEVHEYFYELVAESDAAAQAGNLVRAAIQRKRAARVAPAAQAYDTQQEALEYVEALLERLKKAIDLKEEELPEWRTHLPELLDKADQGAWPSEAALLFDLQKACLDYEREIYTLDVVEWLLSGGRKPIKRPLTSQRFVRITRHLRSAAQRLTRVRLSDADRRHFGELLQTALHRCEERVRARCRPVLASALEDVGLVPKNPFQRTAFAKMVEELLDRIIEYGFISFSDLRDTLSRNQLKLPDLSDPQDFIRGDPLLRLDRRLSTLLDGVYRRGEIYLRWLERFTALNFGTALGRLLTSYVTLPFAAAFLVVYGFHHFLIQPFTPPWQPVVTSGLADVFVEPGVHRPVAVAVYPDIPLYIFLPTWLLTGAFFLGLLHSPRVREVTREFGRALTRPLRAVFVDAPLWVLHNAELKRFVSTWSFQLFYWYFLKPLALCALFWFFFPETRNTWVEVGLTFLAANFLINSRPGQSAAEALNHGLMQFFGLLRGGLIPGLIRLIVQASKQVLHSIEAVLFTVDEWLRFRGGETRLAMVMRIILGVLWFPIAYFARFNLVVLVEPGLNPLKFPICSIAAKILYPMTPVLKPVLESVFAPVLGDTLTWALVVWLLFWLPDVFGFLFWEMKENWSLYRANRGPNLRPVPIGAHGETMRRLLQPGFHSGTIPKLFRKLRHAEKNAERTGNLARVRAGQAALDEVQEAIRLWVERDFLYLLELEEPWRDKVLAVARVALATNQVRIELVHRQFPEQLLSLEFEARSGWLTAGLATRAPQGQTHWLAQLDPEAHRTLHNALAILYKLGGVDLVREQVRACFPRAAPHLTAQGLLLVEPEAAPVLYPLQSPRDVIEPETLSVGEVRARGLSNGETLAGVSEAEVGAAPASQGAAGHVNGVVADSLPTLPVQQILFARVPVSWQALDRCWNSYLPDARVLAPSVPLLPQHAT